ncbi:MAG: sulfatase [Planctomycetaceae bacterium]|nr:sulfatase [Planctomycetaceae bacterium]
MGTLILSILLSCVHLPAGTHDAAEKNPAARRPNIVIIFIDDMGYADIEPFGCKSYATPNLTQMAKQGRKFTDCLVSSAVCSSSRVALLTGCYHQRVGIDGALGPASEIGISEHETTIAELCRAQGYATACFGKWHLGHHPKFLPTAHGFDRYFGIPYSNDMWPLHPEAVARRQQQPTAKSPWPPLPLLRSNAPGEVEIVNSDMQPDDQKLMTRQFTQHAVEFIREHHSQPFFLYLPHPMVHVPLYVSPEYEGRSGAGLFGDAVQEVDWSVGEILRVLDEFKLSENTLVIFTSDNGPWLSYGNHAGSAAPLREGKGTMFEGGCRVPTLMQWAGTIPAGTTCDQLVSTMDFLPTIAKLIGAPLPELKIDGRDIGPLLRAEPGAVSPHDYLYLFYNPLSLHAIRTPRWKLHLPHPYRTLSGRAGGRDGTPVAYDQKQLELALFDLAGDLAETTDVKAEHPGVVAELLAVAERARGQLGDQLTKTTGTEQRPPGRMEAEDTRLIRD